MGTKYVEREEHPNLADTAVLAKGSHTWSKNSQYFEEKNGRPIFDKIFDAILPTHVPSKFWSKFIVLKIFDPDADIALVLAKCSPEDWIFAQNFDRSPHTRQNIDDWSKYIKQIWSVNILSQCMFWQKNLPHMVKNPVKILMLIFCFNILTDFLIVYGPLKTLVSYMRSLSTAFIRVSQQVEWGWSVTQWNPMISQLCDLH